MATQSNTLAWRIPWTEESGGYSPEVAESDMTEDTEHNTKEHIYTMEYYTAIKKNEITPCSVTRVDLEIVILSYRTIALISHASKVMLKIIQASLQQYMNCELPDVQARFRKGRGTRDQIANIRWIIEKTREFQKNIYFCFIDYANAFDCGSQ